MTDQPTGPSPERIAEIRRMLGINGSRCPDLNCDGFKCYAFDLLAAYDAALAKVRDLEAEYAELQSDVRSLLEHHRATEQTLETEQVAHAGTKRKLAEAVVLIKSHEQRANDGHPCYAWFATEYPRVMAVIREEPL